MRAPGDGLDTEYAFVINVLRVNKRAFTNKTQNNKFSNQVILYLIGMSQQFGNSEKHYRQSSLNL